MGWFNGKKKEEDSVRKVVLNQLDKDVETFARGIKASNDESIQMIYMSGKDVSNTKQGRVLTVVGNPHDLIKMLSSAGNKEESFGAILVAAADRVVSSSKNLKKLQEDLANADENCTCDSCTEKRLASGNSNGIIDIDGLQAIPAEKIANMSKEEIDEFVKTIIDKKK